MKRIAFLLVALLKWLALLPPALLHLGAMMERPPQSSG